MQYNAVAQPASVDTDDLQGLRKGNGAEENVSGRGHYLGDTSQVMRSELKQPNTAHRTLQAEQAGGASALHHSSRLPRQ